ncbi:Glycosyl hydrolase family 18 [Gammaproteobacteria bacterium]
MRTRLLFIIAILGLLAGAVSVYVYRVKVKPQPPLAINYNPYDNGIYATGIVESFQPNGSNVNIYPEVAGKVIKILALDGQNVKQGDVLLAIDDSVQKAIVAKDLAQARAALALLEELKAQPRKEILDVSIAQLKSAQDQLEKLQKSYKLNPKSVSKNDLDNAINAANIAQKQYDLVKAGAWIYDIQNQESQYRAAVQAYWSDKALLDKYIIRASADGVVLRMAATVGNYVSPQGVYDTYTQGMIPIATMGVVEPYLAVRCYVDEILVPRLPKPELLEAQMMIRGETNYAIALEFIRMQPYTIPNIELSNEIIERVDVRVLPIVFKFKKPTDINIFPGQLVDVYLKGKKVNEAKVNGK